MNDLLDKIKEYVNDVAYNEKNALPLKDDLDKIIENNYKKAFEILDKYGIIEYIKREYKIDYKKPELEILENETSIIGRYSDFENKISFSKKSIEEDIDKELKFLSYKEKIERLIDEQLKSLGYKEIERKNIEYLNIGYNTILLYPSYINEKDIIESIAKSIVDLAIYHEIWHSIDNSILDKPFKSSIMFDDIWHSIDNSILDKLEKASTIKGIHHLTILNNLELRASAFEVVMYFLDLVNDLKKHEKLDIVTYVKKIYIATYFNILTCRNYIEEIDKLEKDKDKNKHILYDLGFCYGNIIVAKYKSSLKENIYKIIDDIIHLDKERAIDKIKLYGDNLE